MIHVAQIAAVLDELRDAVVELDRQGSASGTARVGELTDRYNAAVTSAVTEIEDLLRQEAEDRKGV